MPKFKKSSGFRMGGYSYPGTSPVMKNDDAVIEAATGVAPSIKVKKTDLKTGETTYKTGYSFDDAFADARKSGKKYFTWKDKKYHTKTKEEI